MSDTTNESNESVTVVGAVDGPRARILAYLEKREANPALPKLTETTMRDVLDFDFNEAGIYVQALIYLLSNGIIHQSKGRGGGLKLGAKPAMTEAKLFAQMLQAAKKDAGLVQKREPKS